MTFWTCYFLLCDLTKLNVIKFGGILKRCNTLKNIILNMSINVLFWFFYSMGKESIV
jgi:hypothetical protein